MTKFRQDIEVAGVIKAQNAINPDELVTKGQLDAGIVSSGGNPNVVAVTNLATLQSVISGQIAEIQGDVDLVNTNVTIPNNVRITDGGGSISTSGTGELTLSSGCLFDGNLLSADLNFNSATEGRLNSTTYVLNTVKYPLNIGIVDPAWDDEPERLLSIENREIIQKALADANLLGCVSFQITKLDAYFYTTTLTESEKDDNNAAQFYPYAPITLLSGMDIVMSDDVYIRAFPNDAYVGWIVSGWNVKNASLTGGNLIGTRETHSYAQYRVINSAATGSTVNMIYGPDSALVNVAITVTPNDAVAQAQEIADYFTNNIAGYTGEVASDSSSKFIIRHETDGFYFRVYSSSLILRESYYDVAYEHGINIIGGQNITIYGTTIEDVHGDGLVTASTSLFGAVPTNVRIEACTFLRSRRINVSLIAGDGILVENNRVIEAGIDLTINTGASPRGNIWCEPYRERDGTTGVLIEYEYSRNITVSNNYVMNGEYSQIAAFNSSNFRAIGNTTNGMIESKSGAQTYIAGNVIDLRLEYNGRSTLGNVIAIKVSGATNADFTEVKRELSVNTIIEGNTIIGNQDDAVGSQTGISLSGWSVNCSGNIIRDIKLGISTDNLVDALINDNQFDNDPIFQTQGVGLVIISGAFADVIFKDNTFKVYGMPLNLNSFNSTGNVSAFNLETEPSLVFDNNTFISYSGVGSEIKAANWTVFKNNVFEDYFNYEGNMANVEWINNDFKSNFNLSTNSASMTNVKFIQNKFRSTTTTAALALRSIAASTNVLLYANEFYQPAGGSRACWIRTEGGGSNNDFKVFNNSLVEGTPTEFLTFIGDTSILTNNIDYYEGTIDQTVTGTGNTIN